ncbi:MAG TPA: PsbP-related protein [Nitrososphaeraceae archaeon]|nr:PsbP-related protein [Nitrososphaeraceae archaeon]
MKLIKTKEIVLTPLLLISIIILSVLISNSINNQQVIAQEQQQQLSPEEIENEILRGNLDVDSDDSGTITTTESSVQSLSNDSVLEYESPAHGIRIQYPDRWLIMIESPSNSSLSLRFSSPPENDTDIFRENVLFEINTISNNTALGNYTSAAITSYLESYPDLRFREVSSTNLTDAAIPAYKLVASRTQEGLDFMQIVAINGDKLYNITYTSDKTRYSTYLPIIEEMINSFEVT